METELLVDMSVLPGIDLDIWIDAVVEGAAGGPRQGDVAPAGEGDVVLVETGEELLPLLRVLVIPGRIGGEPTGSVIVER